MSGQAGECLQPSQDLMLQYEEKIRILLSSGPITQNEDGGKEFMD